MSLSYSPDNVELICNKIIDFREINYFISYLNV